ncbi:MAG: glycosyltransferase family 4 protein [Candidatus Yanofskybacteria bacterium]|nr:glycosyltransferase family 4 protein [Candidatus Yanofskybacteria bacterium]
MLKIGIECESIEGPESWGIGRIVKKLLEEISRRPELANEFRFFLYFKSRIPDYPWLNSPIFVKKAVFNHSQILENLRMNSFSLYYYIFLPIKLWFEKLDLMFFPNYMLPIFFKGRSLVILTEDIYYEINSGTLPWQYKLAYKIFAGWWAARHATKIMAISETSKKEVSRLFNIDSARIVANQLGVDHPKPVTPEPSPSASYGASSYTSYILYIGQAFPRRHLRETMLAFELIAGQFPDLKLIAVGKDKYNPLLLENLKNGINRRIGREGIIYKEYVPENELHQLYAGAKLLIYVSSKEAFGLPPLEALGYGVPAVVSDSEINHEIFGDNAFFVCPEDVRLSSVEALVEGLKTITPDSITTAIAEGLTDDIKREQIKKSAERILEKYTWQGFTDRFLNLVSGH